MVEEAALGAPSRPLGRGTLLPASPPGAPALEIVEEIGHGRFAVVYRARRGADEYAVKVLGSVAADQAAFDRGFRREASLLACIDHPGLPRVHDVGSIDGRPYLVMDLVRGRTLTQVIADGPMPPERVLDVGAQLADALAAVHAAGLVHRDVKPDNLLVGPDGTVRLVDFGFAGRTTDDDAAVGTLLYCAPEQAGTWTRAVDGRADLYSLGAVLFECLTGRPPFTSTDAGELLRLHAQAEPPDPGTLRPDLPEALSRAVVRLLSKDPDDRHRDAAALEQDLREVMAGSAREGEPARSARTPPLVGRARELTTLRERWSTARAGEGTAVVVLGAPGSGKSQLVATFTAEVAGPDTLLLSGKSDRDDSPLAALHTVLGEAVRWLAALEPQRRARLASDLAGALGLGVSLLPTVSPSLAQALDLPAPARGAQEEADRQRQVPAVVAALLRALSLAAGSMILHLDDVQWLDEETASVLVALGEELPLAPILVVLSARNDSESATRVAALRGRLGEAVTAELTLGGLTPDETAGLVAAATGGMTIDADSARTLAASADGNPFTMLQYLRSMIENGSMAPCWGRWRMEPDALHDLALPLDAAALVLSRLDDLDGPTRTMLAFGAALGGQFEERFLTVSGVAQLPLRRALGTAVTRGLLLREGGGRYRFAHDRIREALQATLSPEQVRNVHDAAADLLEAELSHAPGRGRAPDDGASDGGPRGAVSWDGVPSADERRAVYALAAHCRAGHRDRRPERLYLACARAGRLALAEHLPAVALDHLACAHEAAARIGQELDAGCLSLLGTAQHRAGQFEEAAATLRHASTLAAPGPERAAVLDRLARVHDSTWNTDEQAATVSAALTELGAALPRGRLRLVASTVWTAITGLLLLVVRLGYGTARGPARERLRLLTALHEAGALAHARGLAPTSALVYVLRSLWAAHRLGPSPQTARIRSSLAHLLFVVGLSAPARWLSRSARRMGQVLQDPQLDAYLAWLEAFDWYSFGLDQGQRLHRTWAEQHRWLDVGSAHDLHLVLCWDAVVRGDLQSADALFARRRRLLDSRSDNSGRTADHPMDAALAAMRGRVSEAMTHLTAMRDRAELRWELADIVVASSIVAVELDELGSFLDGTAQLLDRLQLSAQALIPSQRALYVYLAYARLEQARTAVPETGTEALARARDAVRALRSAANTPLLRAHAVVAEAHLAQATGRPAEALALLDRAGAALRSVDAPLVAHEAAKAGARACRALGLRGEAARNARQALAIATEEGWPLRQRRTAAEFGIAHDLAGSTSQTGPSDRHGPGVSAQLLQQRLTAVAQVTRAASGVLDPDLLTRTALDETIRVLGAERAYLFLLDESAADDGPPQLVPRTGRTADGHDLDALTGYSTTLVEAVVRTRQAQVFTGTEQGPLDTTHSVVAHGLRSMLAAPVELDGRLLGVVYLDSRVAKGIFSAADVGVLTTISTYVAIALENVRASQLQSEVAAATRERDVADALRRSMLELSQVLDPEQVLATLLTSLRHLLDADAVWFVTADDDGRVRWRTASQLDGSAPDRAGDEHGVADPVTAELLHADGLLMSTAGGGAGPGRVAELPGTVAWVGIPLRTRDRRVGAAVLAATGGEALLAQTDLAGALTTQAMVAYDNACLFRTVHAMATTDELTGVAARRQILAVAEERLRRTARTVLMMVDVDHFKAVNDTHGHAVGDQVLAALATRVMQALGPDGVVGRYGGEEFLIVAEGVAGRLDGGAAVRLGERVRSAVADRPLSTTAGPIAVTVSMGLSAAGGDDTVRTVLERADALLYRAKQSGRNRVLHDLDG